MSVLGPRYTVHDFMALSNKVFWKSLPGSITKKDKILSLNKVMCSFVLPLLYKNLIKPRKTHLGLGALPLWPSQLRTGRLAAWEKGFGLRALVEYLDLWMMQFCRIACWSQIKYPPSGANVLKLSWPGPANGNLLLFQRSAAGVGLGCEDVVRVHLLATDDKK